MVICAALEAFDFLLSFRERLLTTRFLIHTTRILTLRSVRAVKDLLHSRHVVGALVDGGLVCQEVKMHFLHGYALSVHWLVRSNSTAAWSHYLSVMEVVDTLALT